MPTNQTRSIAEINARLADQYEHRLDVLGGLEILLEAFTRKVTDLFGRNSLLAMTYQIGADPATKIAQRMLAARHGAQFADPVEALVAFFEEVADYFHVKVTEVTEDANSGVIRVRFQNECFFRPTIAHREGLDFGGPLCRVNKGYVETALRLLTGWNPELRRTGECFEADRECCVEELLLAPPRE